MRRRRATPFPSLLEVLRGDQQPSRSQAIGSRHTQASDRVWVRDVPAALLHLRAGSPAALGAGTAVSLLLPEHPAGGKAGVASLS